MPMYNISTLKPCWKLLYPWTRVVPPPFVMPDAPDIPKWICVVLCVWLVLINKEGREGGEMKIMKIAHLQLKHKQYKSTCKVEETINDIKVQNYIHTPKSVSCSIHLCLGRAVYCVMIRIMINSNINHCMAQY